MSLETQKGLKRYDFGTPQSHLGKIITSDGSLIPSVGLFVPTTFTGDVKPILTLVDLLSPVYGSNPANLVGSWAIRPLATDMSLEPIGNAMALFANEGCDVIVHNEPTPFADVLALVSVSAIKGFDRYSPSQ